METFKVISSNPNSSKGFVTKINKKELIVTPFGDKTKSTTLYVSGSKQLKLNTDIQVDMSMFTIGEHEMLNPETSEVFIGKWLHLK